MREKLVISVFQIMTSPWLAESRVGHGSSCVAVTVAVLQIAFLNPEQRTSATFHHPGCGHRGIFLQNSVLQGAGVFGPEHGDGHSSAVLI